jgi:urea transport system substrate-binding protein
MRRRGWSVGEPVRRGEHPIGLLTGKSGPAASSPRPPRTSRRWRLTRSGAAAYGSPEATTAPTRALGTAEARCLVRAGCRAILATTTSATSAAQALRPDGVLPVHTVMNEGGLGAELRVPLGERPCRQLTAAADPTMRAADGRR